MLIQEWLLVRLSPLRALGILFSFWLVLVPFSEELSLAWSTPVKDSNASVCSLGSSESTLSLTTENSSKSEEAVQEKPSFLSSLKDSLGITYFTFFNGPGLHPDNFSFNPNQLGKPGNDGINALNQVSFQYKLSGQIALDFQTRFYILFNNHIENENFQILRWETPRIGISGTLAAGKDWKLAGAINTDFPYFFPVPFTGYQVQQRTVIFDPGMFAKFHYAPSGSRWSIFSVVSPRYFFYADRHAAEPQVMNGGFEPESKPELILSLKPTLNYRFSDNTRFTIGTSLDYRKLVMSSWNIFDGTMVTNGKTKSWVLDAVPLAFGITHTISSALTIFPYIAIFPIAIQRLNRSTDNQATLMESASIGMWLNGKIL